MKKFILVLVIFLSGISFCKAQDTIVKKNGDILKVKVTEIGTEEIKFKSFGVPDSPIIVLKKSEVKKVVVSGQVIIDEKDTPLPKPKSDDILVKKDGSMLRINVLEIGTDEVKFKLADNPDGPTISVLKSDIKTLKVGETIVIDNKKESEDQIVKKDGSTLKVKVLEMGTDEIKYKLYGSPPDGPVLSMKKKEIKTVKIDGQVVYEFKEDPYSTSNSSILNKTNDIKMNFFSPLFDYLSFSYEWMEKPGFNWEAGAGFIGIGIGNRNSNNNANNLFGWQKKEPTGFFLHGGPKFLLGSASDIEVDGARIAHPLKGRYFAIDVILQTMTRPYSTTIQVYNPNNGTSTYTDFDWKTRYQDLALNLIYGRQNIYGNAVTVGYYIGFGYTLDNATTVSGTKPGTNTYGSYTYFDPQRYSFYYFGERFPLTFTWGFTVGYIHKPKEKPSTGNKNYKNNPRA